MDDVEVTADDFIAGIMSSRAHLRYVCTSCAVEWTAYFRKSIQYEQECPECGEVSLPILPSGPAEES